MRRAKDATVRPQMAVNTTLAGSVLYPLQERILGRPTFRVLAELEASQWFSADQLHALRARKLRALLERLTTRSSFYKYAFANLGIDPRIDDPWTILNNLPLMDRSAMRRMADSLCDNQGDPRYKKMSTGGSTGEPLTFLVNPLREAYDKASRMRTHRWFNVQPGEREVYLWGVSIGFQRQDLWRNIRDIFLNDLLLSAFDLSADSVKRYVAQMNSYRPACIFGYPSSVATLCELAAEQNCRVQLDHLKAVFVTGEVLDDQQRRTIQQFFGVPVADGYGGRDSGFCAHQCDHGSMHVMDEHIIMEIIGDDGQPVADGEPGEIVITNLDNLATPFVRYRTGDMGQMSTVRCSCGRGLRTMSVVAGRRTDHLVAADGTLRHALSLIYHLRELKGVGQFQVYQRADRSLEVRIVPADDSFQPSADTVLNSIHACVGDVPDARVRIVNRIDRQVSGKFRHVISEAADDVARAASTSSMPMTV